MKSLPFILCLVVCCMLISCTKENTHVDYNGNVLAAEESALMEDIFSEVVSTAIRAGYDTVFHNAGQGELHDATLFYSRDADSVKIRVFFPAWALLGDDEVYRGGVYHIRLDKDLYEEGAKGTLHFDDYEMQRRPIEGSMKIVNAGYDQGNRPVFEIQVDSIHMQTEDSIGSSIGIIKFNAEHRVVWNTGYETPHYFADDRFEYSGTASGQSSRDVSYNTEITRPIGIADTCFWPLGGIYNIYTPALNVKEGSVEFFEEEGCSSLFNMYFDTFTIYEEFYYLYNPPELN